MGPYVFHKHILQNVVLVCVGSHLSKAAASDKRQRTVLPRKDTKSAAKGDQLVLAPAANVRQPHPCDAVDQLAAGPSANTGQYPHVVNHY